VAVEHPGRPQPGLLVPGGAVCPVVGEAGLGAPSTRRDSPTRDSLSPAISSEGIKVRGLSAGGQCSRQTMGSQYASGMMCGLDIPPLHDLSNNKSGLVCDFFKEGDWQLSFRRSLSPQDVVVWEDLMSRLEMVQLNSDTKFGGC